MKKFLLLLVGVLFALSAKADWTFYVDISVTGWTEAPYFYVGHHETFFEAKQCERTPVKNQIYKVTFKDWGDLAELYICKSKLVNTQCSKAQIEAAGTANVDWFGKFSTTAYSQPEYGFDSDNTKTPLFKLTKGSNGASITINYDPTAAEPDPTPSGDIPSLSGNYCFFLNTKSWTEPHAYVWNGGDNNNWNNVGGDKMTQYSGDLYYWQLGDSYKWNPSNIIISDKGNGDNSKRFEKTFTPGAVYNPDGSIKAAEKTTYYFDVAGSEITTTPSLSIGWATVEGVLTDKKGVYRFTVETAIPAKYWVVKFTDNTNNYIPTTLEAEHVYKYVSTVVADKGLYSEYTPESPTPTDYTIYFDAVRSGNGEVSLAVNGLESSAITVSEETVNNHQIKKYEYSAVADTKATFTYAGFSLGEFAPVSGQVYYYNGSAQANEAFEGYTWTPGDTPEPDSPKTIAISGSFYNEPWPGPVTNSAKKFSRVSGSTYTLDLTGYTFDATTEFKIYDVTGIADKNSWGQGYYNSTAIQPNAPTKLTADNNYGNNIKVDATIVNPQITLDVATWTITIKAQEVETTYDYYIHGTILGDNNWTPYKMTAQPDGTWTYTAAFKSEKGFGIKQTESGNANNQTAWICDANKNASIVLGQVHNCVIKTKNDDVDWATPQNSFDGTTKYTLVFDPKEMTIVFINPTAVVATVAAEATTINGANANNLNVDITVADYYKGTGATEYTLSNGSYSASAKPSEGTVSFKNVPYATNYTLKPDNGSAMPINITLPTTTFNISGRYPILVAPAPGSASGTKASLVVYFKATCDWWYNLPQIVCTCDSKPISGTVVWKSPEVGNPEVGVEFEYDFAFIANGVVAYEGKNATEDKTFNFVITPVYPFAVEAPAATPAPSMMRAAAANSFQYVYGAAIDNVEPVEITQHGSTVSGVEGVMIEDEEAPVEYFNLQGQRVNGELAPGIYIRRQGSSVTKVRI